MNVTFTSEHRVAAHLLRRMRDLAVIYAAIGAAGFLLQAIVHAG